jgi:hypothetical protein
MNDINELRAITNRIKEISLVQYNKIYMAFGSSGFSGRCEYTYNPELTNEQNMLGFIIADLKNALTLFNGVAQLDFGKKEDVDGDNR